MKSPVWVPFRATIVIHDRRIARHGGAPGVRDLALLEMGYARAMDLAAYSDAGLTAIAAAYAFGIAKAHAFVDGNLRESFSDLEHAPTADAGRSCTSSPPPKSRSASRGWFRGRSARF